MSLRGKKHINLRLNHIILLVQLLALSSKLCEASIEDSDIQPVPIWLHGSEPDRQPDDRVDKLSKLLDRVGPNIRASSEFHDYADQTVEDSLIAWQAMENQTQRYAQGQVDFYRPKIGSLLSSANVTSNCREATNLTLDAIRRLDSWAIQCKLLAQCRNSQVSFSCLAYTITFNFLLWPDIFSMELNGIIPANWFSRWRVVKSGLISWLRRPCRARHTN